MENPQNIPPMPESTDEVAPPTPLQLIKSEGPRLPENTASPLDTRDVADEAFRQLGEARVLDVFQGKADAKTQVMLTQRVDYLETELAKARTLISELVAEKDLEGESVVIDLNELDPETRT